METKEPEQDFLEVFDRATKGRVLHQDRTWQLARAVVGLFPNLGNLSRFEWADTVLSKYGRQWDALGLSREDAQIHMVSNMRSVRIPNGSRPVSVAFGFARRFPLDSPLGGEVDLPKYKLLLDAARYEQCLMGDSPIVMSTRDVAEELGFRSPETSAKLIRLAVKDEYLIRASVGDRLNRRCPRYRVNREKLGVPPCLPEPVEGVEGGR